MRHSAEAVAVFACFSDLEGNGRSEEGDGYRKPDIMIVQPTTYLDTALDKIRLTSSKFVVSQLNF